MTCDHCGTHCVCDDSHVTKIEWMDDPDILKPVPVKTSWRTRSKAAIKSRKLRKFKRPQYDTATLDNSPHMDGYATVKESQDDPNGVIIWNCGFGVNSVAGIINNLKRGLRIDHILFADTGDEKAETMAYISVFQRQFLAKYGIDVKIVRNTRWKSLRENCMVKKIIPRISIRWCTSDFKRKPIFKEVKRIRGKSGKTMYQYIGIASDEPLRMTVSPDKWNPIVYPLVESKITRKKCKDIIAAEGLPIPKKSGCTFCMFQPISHWRELYINHPDKFQEAIELEENDRNGHALIPASSHKDRVYLRDLKKIFDGHKKDGDISEYLKTDNGVDLQTLTDQACGGSSCMT